MKISTLFISSIFLLSHTGAYESSRKRLGDTHRNFMKEDEMGLLRESSGKAAAGEAIDMAGLERLMVEERTMMDYSMSMPASMSLSMSMPTSMSYGFDGPEGMPSKEDNSNNITGGNGGNNNSATEPPSMSNGTFPPTILDPNATSSHNFTMSPTASPTSKVEGAIPSDDTTYAPTASPTPVQEGLECIDDEIYLVDAENGTTVIPLTVGYLVESTSNSTVDYLSELEIELLYTAIRAALGCPGWLQMQNETEDMPNFFVDSVVITSCNATLEESESCALIETAILFYINGIVDSERAIFNGYSAIEASMSNGTYVSEGNLPTVVRIEFLSPLPLIDPSWVSSGPQEPATRSVPDEAISLNDSKSVSGWAIGVGVAAVFGVLVTFMVWSYKRHNRQNRHVFFLESIGMPNDSAADDISVP